MIIEVLGRKGSGKDTVSDYVVNKFNFEKMTLADHLKTHAEYCLTFQMNNSTAI